MPDAPPPPVPPFPFTPTFDGIPFPTGPIDLARRPRRANYVFSFEERGENRAELMATYTVISWLRRRFREVDMRPISPTALAWDLRTPWVTPALVNGVLSRLLAQSHAGAGNTVLVGEETIYTFRDPCEIEAPWTEEDASAALRTAHRLPDLPMDELLGGKGLPMWARRLRAVVQDTADPAVDVDKAVRAFYGLLGGDLFEGVVPWDMRVRAMLTTLQEQIVAKGFDAMGEVGAARFVLPFSREGVRGFGWLGELVARLGWPAFTDVGLAGAKQHPELVARLAREAHTDRPEAEMMLASFLTAMGNPEVKDRLELHLGMHMGHWRTPRTPWELIVEAIDRAGKVSGGEAFRFLAIRVFHDPKVRRVVSILVDFFEGRRGYRGTMPGAARLTGLFDDLLTPNGPPHVMGEAGQVDAKDGGMFLPPVEEHEAQAMGRMVRERRDRSMFLTDLHKQMLTTLFGPGFDAAAPMTPHAELLRRMGEDRSKQLEDQDARCARSLLPWGKGTFERGVLTATVRAEDLAKCGGDLMVAIALAVREACATICDLSREELTKRGEVHYGVSRVGPRGFPCLGISIGHQIRVGEVTYEAPKVLPEPFPKPPVGVPPLAFQAAMACAVERPLRLPPGAMPAIVEGIVACEQALTRGATSSRALEHGLSAMTTHAGRDLPGAAEILSAYQRARRV